MKYLIDESQFDRLVFKYLDMQNFFHLEDEGDILFWPSEIHWRERLSYAIISTHRKSNDCYISCSLLEEISNFFSISLDECLYLVASWVENKFDITVGEPYSDCGAG